MKFGIPLCLILFLKTGAAFAGLTELKYLTSNYLAFVESQWVQYQTSPVFGPSREKCPETMQAYREKVEDAALIRESFLVLEEMAQDPEDAALFAKNITQSLEHFLLRRMAWLKEREAAYQEFRKQVPRLNAGEGMKIQFVHTTPEQIKRYPPGGLYAQMAQIALMDYTIINRIIREIYEMLPSTEIEGELEFLLRSSPALHKFLLRETTDPGVPEDAFMLDKRTPKTTGDLIYYTVQTGTKKLYRVKDVMLGAPRDTELVINLTPREAFELKAKTMNGESILSPALPGIERLLSAKKLEEANKRNLLQPPVFYNPPRAATKRTHHSSSLSGKRPLGSGVAASLSHSPRDGVALEVVTEQKSEEGSPRLADVLTAPLKSKSGPSGHLFQENSSNPLASSEVHEQEASLESESAKITEQPDELSMQVVDHGELEADLDAESVVRKPRKELQPTATGDVTHSHKSSSKTATQASSGAPRFRRVFHPKQGHAEAFVADLDVLKKKRALWLENLFNRRLKTVRYRDFKKVWLDLGGKIGLGQDQNGSHFELLDSRGRVVGGIFAHGEGQEYSSPYHPVLRDAFNMIGVRF